MDIYIKPPKKVLVIGGNKVLIEDLTEVVATKDVADRVKKLTILDISKTDNQDKSLDLGKKDKKKKAEKSFYLVQVTDIVKAIKKAYPDITIQNLGEMDTVVEYKAEKSQEKKYFRLIKICFVALVLFIGSFAAIMSFHTDAEMSKVFENFYYILFKVKTDKPLLIEIPYAIGLVFGVIVFFNHLFGKRITMDLTPIEVEMPEYEKNVNNAIIDMLSTGKKEEDEMQNDNS